MSTILLVEDEVLILETTRELLELLGHRVFTTSSGRGALKVLKEQKGRVDLIILDLSLPDMNGYDLLPSLATEYPGGKIVICSGALPDELDFEDQPAVKGILNKPFELRDLREVVGRALSGD